MFTRSDKQINGFSLIALLVAILIIAAIFSGFYFSKNKSEISTPAGQIKALKQAEKDLEKIDQITENRNQITEEN